MRIIGITLFLALFLTGCGAKKRTATSGSDAHANLGKGKSAAQSDQDADIALPDIKEEFVYFSISSIEEYIATFAPIAQFEMKAYGIPASITLAQGIIESGFGQGELTRKTNNHFGIKCHTGWDGDYAHHDDDEKGECFRKYKHPMYSYRDHSIFLSSRSRYASLFDLPKDDYKGWAKGLKEAGYATDRHYPKKLISFIERYRLYEFDHEVLPESAAVATGGQDIEPYGMHVVQQGDTLYSLSKRYLTTVPELMKLNNLKNSSLAIGQKLRVSASGSKR